MLKVASNDSVLRPYKRCTRWKKEFKKSLESLKQQKLFKETERVQKLILEVKHVLGGVQLPIEEIRLLYKICSYETAWNHPHRPWCHIFNDQRMKIFEFWEDIKYYYKDGYGHDLTTKLCCNTARDLLEALEYVGKQLEISITLSNL